MKQRGLRKFPVTEDGLREEKRQGDGQPDSASQPQCRMGQEAPDSHYWPVSEAHVSPDPGTVLGHIGIDTWTVGQGTALAPAHHTH